MNNSLTKITYETSLGTVDLDFQTVKNYLVRGQADKITDQEVILFMKTCQAQKLNPFAQGEAYLIKFGSDPAQMVVGKDAYMRRAEENPAYRGHKSGIVVLRGDQVIQKEGTCLYPGETLVGGWCRVHRTRNGGSGEEVFKEVSLKEYDKGQANWKTKPCTMIEKVAVSQALRAAFPKDYEGMYVAEEVSEQGYTDAEYEQMGPSGGGEDEVIDMTPITQEQRKTLFRMVHQKLGKEDGNALVQAVLAEFNLESTNGMPVSTYSKVMARVTEVLESCDGDAGSTDHAEGSAE
jgi:phage recombination protein bet